MACKAQPSANKFNQSSGLGAGKKSICALVGGSRAVKTSPSDTLNGGYYFPGRVRLGKVFVVVSEPGSLYNIVYPKMF